jgi:hypothetical protein
MKKLIGMRKVCSPFGLVVVLLVFGLAHGAEATLMTFSTSAGATQNDLPVSAKAVFDISDGHIQVVLENLIVNPKSVVQNISGISFVIDSGNMSAVLSSSFGQERNVRSDKTYIDGQSVDTGWVLHSYTDRLHLTVLDTAIAPKHTIIGSPDESGLYNQANKSLAGNGPHNPFLNQKATFELEAPGLDKSSTVSSVVFGFNTQCGNSTPGDNITIIVPEPATMILLALGNLLFILRKRTAAIPLRR